MPFPLRSGRAPPVDEQQAAISASSRLLGKRLLGEHLVPIEEPRVDPALDEVVEVEYLLQVRDVRRHADHPELRQGALHPRSRTFAVPPPGGHLREQRVVIGRDFDPVVERALDADPRSGRVLEQAQSDRPTGGSC